MLKGLTKEPLFYRGEMLCVAYNILKTFCIVTDKQLVSKNAGIGPLSR